MERSTWRPVSKCFLMLSLVVLCSDLALSQNPAAETNSASADAPSTSEVLKKIDQLVEQNRQLEAQNQELMKEIQFLRGTVALKSEVASLAAEPAPIARATPSTTVLASRPAVPSLSTNQSPSGNQEQLTQWGAYTNNLGFKIANTEHGDVNLSIYTYVRYLNQRGLDPTYTNYFGTVSTLQQRQDVQIQKVQIKFLGWLVNQKFRYFLYAWTSNASQGLPAQVVLAGNVNFNLSKYFNIAGGITSLPGTRSVEGNFPFWLGVDTRLIADEFFRPSYTSGIWARGQITKGLSYQTMLGNNLSTLGVSAAQLNNKFNTTSTALIWTPLAGNYGVGFGDFENHERVATRLAAHYTQSEEDRQEQPNSDSFENTQIRLEDGTVIFTPGIFGPGVLINDVTYKMSAYDGGIKYRGYSVDAEYFLRWLNHFEGTNTAGIPTIFSQGYQLQASAMVLPQSLQVYLGGSHLWGHYGSPFDFRAGINWFPWHNKVLRWNTEFLYLNNSPVGYTSVPFPLGGNGPVFHSNVELAF
jgi:hypothetical protein